VRELSEDDIKSYVLQFTFTIMTLMVRCKNCGNEFQSQVHMDKDSFESHADKLSSKAKGAPIVPRS
jgi:hypothetical protein